MKNIVICHYNTPELTVATIKSINKYSPGFNIYVFDNSNKKPFVNIFDNVTVFDNTHGQYLDFANEAYKMYGKHHDANSFNHTLSVEKCMELVNDNFILCDSDIIVKQDITELWDESKIFVAFVNHEEAKKYGDVNIHTRCYPYLMFINVKICKEHNVHFFNKDYMINMTHYGFDTGGSFYKFAKQYSHTEIKDIYKYINHYQGASYDTRRGITWFLEANKQYYE